MTQLKFWTINLALSIFITTIPACSGSETPTLESGGGQASSPASETQSANSIQGTVVETMNSGGYTYVRVDTGAGEIWAAGPESQITVGTEINLAGPMPMQNFHSNTLDRTFEILYFVGSFGAGGTSPNVPAVSAHGSDGAPTPSSAAPSIDLTGIDKIAGGYTVAELFEKKGALTGKEVAVRGRVVKFNGGIMNRNWLHLQDGSGSGDTGDITVTTMDGANVGDLVTVRGILKTDEDFGFGYAYEVLIEEASVTAD